jgi:hypothetical protein
MATLATNIVTLADLKAGMDPNGAPATAIEILNETNEILEDMSWLEGNLPTGHQHSVRTGLPTPAWRLLNYGVPQSKGTQVQVTDTCGMLESYSEVDKKLLGLNGYNAGWRLQQDRPFVEAFGQTLADTVFYGNTAATPERFLGLAPRFASSSAGTGQNIVKADSSASGATQTSVWLIGWSNTTIHGIYPKGSMAGLQIEDLGEDTKVDSNGLMYQVMRSHFEWDCGLAVPDWRYVVRICNIDIDNLTKTGSTGSDLIDAMTQALEIIESLSGVRPCFYANRKVRSFLRRQIANKVVNSTLTMDTVAGKRVMTFDEVPVKRCDAILNTEAVVS